MFVECYNFVFLKNVLGYFMLAVGFLMFK